MENRPGFDVLLVEDIRDSLDIFARILRGWGYVVRESSTVQDAMNGLEFDPPIVITDLFLENRPDGSGRDYDGESIIRHAWERNPSCFRVVWSAYAMELPADRKRRLMAIANLIVTKPMPSPVYDAFRFLLPPPINIPGSITP